MSEFREAEFARWHDVGPGPDPQVGRPGDATHRFYLAGASGTVQFVYWLYAADNRMTEILDRRWQGVDVGYHSPVPRYPEQMQQLPDGEACEALRGPLKGRPCFYDGSGLRAEEWLERLVQPDGTVDPEQVYVLLADYYHHVFGADVSDATAAPHRTLGEMAASMRDAAAALAGQDDPRMAGVWGRVVAEYDQAHEQQDDSDG